MSEKIDEKSPAWQRKEGKNPSGGLNSKGVASYRAENPGSKLKTAVTTPPDKLKKGSKAANRRKSFCARMKGMKNKLTSAKTAGDKDSRINKSLRKWNCSTELPDLGSLNEKKKVNPWAVCHASTGPKKTDKFERCVKDVKKKSGYSMKERIATRLVIQLAKMLIEEESPLQSTGVKSSNAPGHVERMKGNTKRIRKAAKAMGNKETDSEGNESPIIGKRGQGRVGATGKKVSVKEPEAKGLGKGGKHTTRADALGHGNAGKYTKDGKPAANPRSKSGQTSHDKANKFAGKREAPLSKKQIDSMGSASLAARKAKSAERMETVKKVFADRLAKKQKGG